MKNQKGFKWFVGASVLLLLAMILSMVACGAEEPSPSPTPAPPPVPEKVYEWTLQTLWPRGEARVPLVEDIARFVDEESNGRLKINVFAEPEIVPADQLFGALQNGTVDMADGGVFWSMILPVVDVEFGLPHMWTFPGETFEGGAGKLRKLFYESGLIDLLRREYAKHNIYFLDIHTSGPSTCLVTKPVKTLEDIEGLKLADVGGWMTLWHEKLGWAPVPGFPGSEVYMGLKLGTIDAVEWGLESIIDLGWPEVAPYWIINEGYTDYATMNMTINMDSWNSLPDDLKAVLVKAGEYSWQIAVEAYSVQVAEAKHMAEEGTEVNVVYLDEAYEQAATEAAYEVWDEAAKGDPAIAEAIELIKKYQGIE